MFKNFIFEKIEGEKFDKIWEEFNLNIKSTFLSSIYWIKFQEKIGRNTHKYLIYFKEKEISNLIGIVYIEIYKRKIANFAYSPYGPIIDNLKLKQLLNIDEKEALLTFFKEFQEFQLDIISENRLNLFRIDPLINHKEISTLKQIGYHSSFAPTQAKDIWEIDITQSIEELRSEMTKSTRYNINKTSREGFLLVKVETDEELLAFSNLMNETTNRKNFSNFDYKYFKEELKILGPEKMCEIYLVSYKDKYLAGCLINFYQDKAYYTHGCSTSDPQLAKLRAPYFLQWEMIKKAKEKGLKKYNMWGVYPQNKKEKGPLSGVSEFKKSLGGYELNLIGGLDYGKGIKYLVQRLADWYIYRKERY